MPRRSQDQVAASRATILRTAVDEVSVRGFEAASIGQLASSLGMSKSGLIRHFGDKEQLQIATFTAGVDLFVERVWEPVQHETPGVERLVALCDAWLDFHAARVMPGGCLMTTAMVEFDARGGAVHEAVSKTMRRWQRALERDAEQAVADGDLPAGTRPADVAFELNALASWASTNAQLHGDAEAFETARRLMHRVLGR